MSVRFFANAVIAVLTAISWPAFAQDMRAVEMLKSKGFQRCAGSTGDVTEFIYDKDKFGFVNMWNVAQTDRRSAMTVTSKQYSDGRAITVVSTAPNVAGSCDSSFTQVLVADESCTKVRETTFKDWKYWDEVDGLPFYEDPTSKNVVVTLNPFKGACLVIKTGILFF
jgi:hypothetical protein